MKLSDLKKLEDVNALIWVDLQNDFWKGGSLAVKDA